MESLTDTLPCQGYKQFSTETVVFCQMILSDQILFMTQILYLLKTVHEKEMINIMHMIILWTYICA